MNSLFPPVFQPAHFSPDRKWRYRLERRWGEGKRCGFILLNPSTADESNDDPTIRRCIDFAKRWGFGGLVLCNIFAVRSTDPAALYGHADPVGPENDAYLERPTEEVGVIVCGWGVHGAYRERGAAVLDLLREKTAMAVALKLTADGHPGHPLYLAKSTEFFPL